MNTISKNRRNLINISFLLVSLFIALVMNNGSFTAVNAKESLNDNLGFSSSIHSNTTIEEDFCDNSLLVVMDSNVSKFRGISEEFSDNLFGHINADKIINLTELPEKYINSKGSISSSNAPELARHFSEISFKQILRITLPQRNKQNVLDTIKVVEKLDGVLYAGPDYLETADTPNPDDTRLSEQWALVGTNSIKARGAWGITPGTRNVRVGVIDSGIATHNDLNDNVVAGWDWFNNNATTNDDIGGHGTSAAGIIGAVGNNATGVSGVAQRVSLVPMQTASDTSGSGSHPSWSRVDAILNARDLWDTDNRISILNHSISGFGTNFTLLAAVEQFPGLFVWSAGNNGNNLDNFTNIGQFNTANLISVGAHDNNNARSIWNTTQSSNYGNAVNIYAPGTDCLTTHSISTTAYRNFGGTSAAAPYVAGVAALMLSANPTMTGITGETLGARLKNAILNSADTITITIPNPSGAGTVSRDVFKLNAIEAVAGVAFQINQSGNVTIQDVNFNPIGELVIPESISGRVITQIGSSAFSGQNQLTRITIPSTVTTIGANAFSNTNNARIDLEGRTTSPSTFNTSWNSSNNPVYLSGVRCYHTSRTLASINSTTHGERCDKCRTTINITSHAYTNYIWKNYNQHSTTCGCGAFKLQGHAVASGDPGYPYKTCLHCGGPAQYGFVQLGGRIPMIELVPSLFIQEYFGNGSYLLSNGIYVISDEDLDGFYDGTLVLPESCDDCHEHLHSSDCEHHATECLDCNSYNCEDNLANSNISKTHYILDKKEEIFEFGY